MNTETGMKMNIYAVWKDALRNYWSVGADPFLLRNFR